MLFADVLDKDSLSMEVGHGSCGLVKESRANIGRHGIVVVRAGVMYIGFKRRTQWQYG